MPKGNVTAKKMTTLLKRKRASPVSRPAPVSIKLRTTASRNNPIMSSNRAADTIVLPTGVCRRSSSSRTLTETGIAEIDKATPTRRACASLSDVSGKNSHAREKPEMSGTRTPPIATARDLPECDAISRGRISIPANKTRKKIPNSAATSRKGLCGRLPISGYAKGIVARAANRMPAKISPIEAGCRNRSKSSPKRRVAKIKIKR